MQMQFKIDIDEAVRYMGYRSAPDEEQMKLISQRARLIEETIKPAVIYKVFDTEETTDGIKLRMTNITLEGEDIKRHLAGCGKCVLMCATAGLKADEMIRRAQAEDISLGFITDALASAAVEAVCNVKAQSVDVKLLHPRFRCSPG